jgi:hypothetical protein
LEAGIAEERSGFKVGDQLSGALCGGGGELAVELVGFGGVDVSVGQDDHAVNAVVVGADPREQRGADGDVCGGSGNGVPGHVTPP